MEEIWRKKPSVIEAWPSDIQYVLAIDENGTPDLSYLRKCRRSGNIPERNHKQFTVTGACFSREAYSNLKNNLDEIKLKYWVNGNADYKGRSKKVCFHYSEVARREHPFNIIMYDNFYQDLSSAVKGADCQIFSCSMDKLKHLEIHETTAHHPYKLSMGFIMERFCHFLNVNKSKGIIMIESRRNKDSDLLRHLTQILDSGNGPNRKEHFRNIKGIYFNPKWRLQDGQQSTYSILEYADYVSRIIHDYVHFDGAAETAEFNLISDKLYSPKGRYEGWGLKIYPPINKNKTASVGNWAGD